MVSVAVAVKKKNTTKPTALYCERAVACGIRRRRTTTSSKGAKSSEHIRSAAAAVSRLCYARTKYCMNEFDKSLEHTHTFVRSSLQRTRTAPSPPHVVRLFSWRTGRCLCSNNDDVCGGGGGAVEGIIALFACDDDAANKIKYQRRARDITCMYAYVCCCWCRLLWYRKMCFVRLALVVQMRSGSGIRVFPCARAARFWPEESSPSTLVVVVVVMVCCCWLVILCL